MKKIKWKKIIPLLIGCSAATLTVSIATPLLVTKTSNHVKTLVNKYGFTTPISSNQNIVSLNGLAYLIDNSDMTATVIGYQRNLNVNLANNNDSKSINSSDIQVNKNNGELVIPSIINNNGKVYVVESIGVGAFFNEGITDIVLPSTIKSIDADAFANNKLTQVNLPNNLQQLGNNAFSNNLFGYGVKIYLPTECQWNKNGNLAPFNNTNNLGKFAPGVETIIQNSAVYEYSSVSNVWRIQSYLPSIADNVKSHVTPSSTALHYQKINDSLKAPTKQLHFNYHPITVPTNSSLATTRILFQQARWNWYEGSAEFKNSQIILNNVKNKSINLTIYSPTENKTIFNSQTNNQTSIPIQDGDILNFGVSNIHPKIITHVPVNQKITTSNYKELNVFYEIANSTSWQNGETTSFMVTQNGLIPYQNITHIQNNILVHNADKDYEVQGTTLANHNVSIQVGNSPIQNVQSNINGVFKFKVPKTTTLNTLVKVKVDGCYESNFKLIGANPVKSALLFEIGANKFGLSPNGYDGKFEIWNTSNNSMPDYNNPSPSVTSNYFDGKAVFKTEKLNNSTIILKNSAIVDGKPVSSSVTINLENIKTYLDLQNDLNSLKYYPNVKNELSILLPVHSNYLFATLSNGLQISTTSQQVTENQKNYEEYLLNIDSNGIQNATYSYQNSSVGLAKNWIASNYMLVTTDTDGKLITMNLSYNWDDPTPLMWKIVKEVTYNLQTNYQKAVALSQWVFQNMTYTLKYTYGKAISQTFNHLEGVCGNYATLLAVMCQMAGMVSRVVYGEAISGANYFSDYWVIDHAWTQIWDNQLGQWITIDPTWNWYTPYGQVQNSMNIARSDEHIVLVLWPKHTNYFSYFEGNEDQALNLLGMFYGVKQGQNSTLYPAQYAINFAQILKVAGSYKDNEFGRIANFIN